MTGTPAAAWTAPTAHEVRAGARATYAAFAGLGLAAGRVSVITSIGYCGFVSGPPLIGFLADRSTVGHALLVITILMALSAAIAGAARRPLEHHPQAGSDIAARTAVL